MKKEKIDDMIQSAVRLPRNLHERLKKAGGERGMGEEIRRRLEASFAAEAPSDPKTRELLDKIERLALNTPLDEPWHADREVFEVFKAAINATLSSYQPSSETPGPTGRLQSAYGQDATPETIGRILAGVTGTFRWREAGQSERERAHLNKARTESK
jgi:hypothetical protein